MLLEQLNIAIVEVYWRLCPSFGCAALDLARDVTGAACPNPEVKTLKLGVIILLLSEKRAEFVWCLSD